MATPAEIVSAIDVAILTWAENGCAAELTLPGVGTKRFTDLGSLRALREHYASLAYTGGPVRLVRLRPGEA